jgi:hypothetical protein
MHRQGKEQAVLGRENRQNNFLDSWTHERMLPKEDPLLEIKEKID